MQKNQHKNPSHSDNAPKIEILGLSDDPGPKGPCCPKGATGLPGLPGFENKNDDYFEQVYISPVCDPFGRVRWVNKKKPVFSGTKRMVKKTNGYILAALAFSALSLFATIGCIILNNQPTKKPQ